MENYAPHLRTSTASKEIFPNVALGFTDSVAAVREETVKVGNEMHAEQYEDH